MIIGSILLSEGLFFICGLIWVIIVILLLFNTCVINNFAYKLVLYGTILWEMIRFYTFCESVYVVL